MSIARDIAPKEVQDVCTRMMSKYHGDFCDAKLDVQVMFAKAARNEGGELEANPIVIAGQTREAKTKIISHEDRVASKGKIGDVRITIDEDAWNDLSSGERDALIDQQLSSIELKKDSEDEVKRDDFGRPQLRKVRPDNVIILYHGVQERHKDNSPEYREMKAWVDKHGQAYFGWNGDNDPRGTENAGKLPGLAADSLKGSAGKDKDPDMVREPVRADEKPNPGRKAKRASKVEFQPTAPPGSTDPKSVGLKGDVLTPAQLGLDGSTIQAARYPNLLKDLGGIVPPKINRTVELKGRSLAQFIAVMPPDGVKADYMLVPLLPKRDEAASDDSQYTGAMVDLKGEKLYLGSADQCFLVNA